MNGKAQPATSANYIHNRPASLKSKLIQLVMRLIGRKYRMEKTIKAGRFASEAAPLPRRLRDQYNVETSEINQRTVWTLKPPGSVSQKTILYIHGGGYISNLTVYDWRLAEELLVRTEATIIVADFPLAPASCYADVYHYFDVLYALVLAKTSHRNIVFMGNSAGGGIALGFTQKLRNEKRSQPSQLILISPWLDITLTNPDIMDIDPKDNLLGVKGLQMAGHAYAKGLDAKDYRLSPIYGELGGLGKISIFIGTHDIFSADTGKFRSMMSNAGIPMNYYEYPEMFHLWVLVPGLRESRHTIEKITELINARD